MKRYQILICLTLLLCLNAESPCNTDTASNRDFCTSRQMSESEKAQQATKCCYLQTTILGVKGSSCIPIDDSSYNDIKKFIDDLKEKTGATELSIDCNQNYLKYSLLLILFILV